MPALKSKESPWRVTTGSLGKAGFLAIPSYSPELSGQEVIRWPGAAYGHFAVLQLLGSSVVPVLVFLHTLGVDQVGDIDKHPLGSDLLAANFFLERIEELMNLH